MSKLEKKKMATSRQVYDRIIWDIRLDSSVFVIGFQERMSSTGVREKPLTQWEGDGDIPWHRIRYIRCGDVVVWNREQHLDLISGGELPQIAWKKNISAENNMSLPENNQVIFPQRHVYRYHLQNWEVDTQPLSSVNSQSLTIVSFNVLCNLYEAEKIQTEKRLPVIVEHLRKCNADIIAIQEATPPLVQLLLSQDWVKDYYISESSAATTVKTYGNLLLSRLPFTLVEHQFAENKRVLVGTWQINEEFFHVAVVHLTSDYAKNALDKRKHQLSTIIKYLQQYSGSCLIVGDFNIKGDEQTEVLTEAGFVDVWREVNPDDPGYTFDPERNSLAALMSLYGIPARLDRILLKSQNQNWISQSMNLFACEPLENLEATIFPSDHFGIRAVLGFSASSSASSLSEVRPVYQSAVVIIPPDDVLPPIQNIRQLYDARFERWMPHINLIYGFLPESYFADAVEIMTPALAQLSPFLVTLADFQTFTHRKNSTAWLRPVTQPETALQHLQAILQTLFPQCDEQSSKSPNGFTPHLSVGQFPTPEAVIANLPQWFPVSFRVESIALISRRDDEPFAVRQIVHLGKPEIYASSPELIQIINQLEPELSSAQQLQRDTVLEVVTQACTECLGFPASIHLLGSARLGVQSPDSDLDAVCLIPQYLSGEVFLANVEQRLQGLCDRSKVVLDAKIPVLRLKLAGISLDLLYARTENWEQGLKNLQLKDEISLKSIIGCWEADLIMEKIQPNVSLTLYRWLLRAVRAWAKSRCIYGNAWGFLGGFSWALLAAWSCLIYKNADMSLDALFHNFFQLLNQHDWGQPISLTDAGKRYPVQLPRDYLPVVTSIEPCQNTARNVTQSTVQILQQEFTRGAVTIEQILVGKLKWDSLFVSTDLHNHSLSCLISTGDDKNQDPVI